MGYDLLDYDSRLDDLLFYSSFQVGDRLVEDSWELSQAADVVVKVLSGLVGVEGDELGEVDVGSGLLADRGKIGFVLGAFDL